MTLVLRLRLVAPPILAGTLLLATPGLALASGPAGSVHQVSGKDGCYTTDGSSAAGPGTCRKIRGGNGSTSLKVSPDGRSAYLVGYGTNGIIGGVPVLSVFHRDPRTGILRQLAGAKGCFSTDGLSPDGPNTCTDARNLGTGDATSLTISRDGRFIYVASQYMPAPGHEVGGIAIFGRNLITGALSQLSGKLGCISATGESEDGPDTCAGAREVDSVSNVHLTPDQKYLYASVYDGQPHSGVAIFRRDSKNGTLRQLKGKDGCVTCRRSAAGWLDPAEAPHLSTTAGKASSPAPAQAGSIAGMQADSITGIK